MCYMGTSQTHHYGNSISQFKTRNCVGALTHSDSKLISRKKLWKVQCVQPLWYGYENELFTDDKYKIFADLMNRFFALKEINEWYKNNAFKVMFDDVKFMTKLRSG